VQQLITAVGHGVPAALSEVITLGRTLTKRAADVLAYFDRPGTSNGPTEAINGRLEHLRGSALGLRNPHQLHRQITPGNRRIQTPTTPWIVKSRIAVIEVIADLEFDLPDEVFVVDAAREWPNPAIGSWPG
jgi:hypothetical protein